MEIGENMIFNPEREIYRLYFFQNGIFFMVFENIIVRENRKCLW